MSGGPQEFCQFWPGVDDLPEHQQRVVRTMEWGFLGGAQEAVEQQVAEEAPLHILRAVVLGLAARHGNTMLNGSAEDIVGVLARSGSMDEMIAAAMAARAALAEHRLAVATSELEELRSVVAAMPAPPIDIGGTLPHLVDELDARLARCAKLASGDPELAGLLADVRTALALERST